MCSSGFGSRTMTLRSVLAVLPQILWWLDGPEGYPLIPSPWYLDLGGIAGSSTNTPLVGFSRRGCGLPVSVRPGCSTPTQLPTPTSLSGSPLSDVV